MRRRAIFSLTFALIVFASLTFAQQMQHFYNVDKEITIEGTIQQISMEPLYKNRSPFLIVILEQKETKQQYRVEISPVWFFEQDLHQGESFVVTGSLYTTDEGTQNVIAREIRFRGATLILRDKHGFPNWRGGPMKQKGRRKGKGN
jgi:hypothetical protein